MRVSFMLKAFILSPSYPAFQLSSLSLHWLAEIAKAKIEELEGYSFNSIQ